MKPRIKDNYKTSTSQLFSFVPNSYLDRTSRPIYALVYLLVFMIIYEVGTIAINPEILSRSMTDTRIVVSFAWGQNLLEYLGFSQRMTWIAMPLVVMVILLALQITSKTRWHVRLKDFTPMTFECILLAIPLIVLSLLFNRSPQANTDTMAFRSQATAVTRMHSPAITLQAQVPVSQTQTVSSSYHNEVNPLLVNIVTGIGAGIYEEFVFRLILICLLMLLLQDFLNISWQGSIFLSISIAALLFSAHHHIFFVDGRFQTGEPFSISKFIFRTLAGVYFAVLFAIRGFGITAGTHAFYNIIAAGVNAFLFT